MIVHPAIKANIIAIKTGKILVPVMSDRKPKSTGVSMILRFENAISIPIMDWDVSFL